MIDELKILKLLANFDRTEADMVRPSGLYNNETHNDVTSNLGTLGSSCKKITVGNWNF
jgi:hypothetical protein